MHFFILYFFYLIAKRVYVEMIRMLTDANNLIISLSNIHELCKSYSNEHVRK